MSKFNLPKDVTGDSMFLVPAEIPVAVTYDTSISSSTSVALNEATNLIEVSALSQPIFMKWGGTASSSSFDGFIAAGTTRHYPVPPGVRTVQFIEQGASATLVVIEYK